jgi:3-dehydro-L-gulonate 2-dehydrogenase
MGAERADRCARLFCETTRDGVYSHGINRFPRLMKMIENGSVDVNAEPVRESGFGAMERWDGRKGMGNLNAEAAMQRAIELGRAHGIGLVAMGNTNHWMRGGSYGWQAAEAGMIGLCWTNTMGNLTPWGGLEPVLGNNPMVLAVPRLAGPVVLDMAISQYSFGAIESYRKRGEMLPVAGGFDEQGLLTCDAAAIERTQRALPIGCWKGAGLSMVLDMIAAMLALGRATHQIQNDSFHETSLSQVFVAIRLDALGGAVEADKMANAIVDSLHACKPEQPGRTVRYPGEKTLKVRHENMKLGLPVEDETWAQILQYS